MKVVFKWWIALELSKLILILVSLFVNERTTGTACLMVVIISLTIVSYVKSWPLLRKITNKLFIEEDLQNRQLLSRSRLILLTLMLFDLIPFLPVIQAILRYEYHKRSGRIDDIILGGIKA